MKKFLVICYSVHEQRIASATPVNTQEEAINFLAADARNTFSEEYDQARGKDKESIILVFDDETYAVLSSYGEYVWTWEIVEIE